MKTQKMRATALLTGGVLAVSALGATSAQAKVSRKDYKTGAAVLGVLGVILAAKGKTVPAIIVGAGAYYAYKQGQKTRDDVYPTDRRQARNNSNRDNRYDSSYDDVNYDSNCNANTADSSYNSDDRYAQNDANVYPDALTTRKTVSAKTVTSHTETTRDESAENDADISID